MDAVVTEHRLATTALFGVLHDHSTDSTNEEVGTLPLLLVVLDQIVDVQVSFWLTAEGLRLVGQAVRILLIQLEYLLLEFLETLKLALFSQLDLSKPFGNITCQSLFTSNLIHF